MPRIVHTTRGDLPVPKRGRARSVERKRPSLVTVRHGRNRGLQQAVASLYNEGVALPPDARPFCGIPATFGSTAFVRSSRRPSCWRSSRSRRSPRRSWPAPAPAHRRGGAVLHPRSQGRPRVRPQAEDPGPRGGRRGLRRHARLLREAAHHRRVEGPDQRSRPGRELPDQQGSAHRAAAPQRAERAGHALWLRVPRPHLAPVRRRPGDVGGDRRAHHRWLRACRCRWASRTAPAAA